MVAPLPETPPGGSPGWWRLAAPGPGGRGSIPRMNGLLVLAALASLLAAVGLFLSARARRAALRTRDLELAAARGEAEAARKEGAAGRAEARERREEAAALRAELKEARRKAFEQQEAHKRLGGAPALREEIDKLSARLAEARSEAAHRAEQVKGLEAQLERAARELDRARERTQPPAPEPKPAPRTDEGQLTAERERADKAEAKAVEARRRIAEMEKDLKLARGRLETERRLYLVQKGELEVAQDRCAELKRRYEDLRKDHEELLEAVKQAAREERRLAEAQAQGGGEGDTPARG